jgi:hypothetical protein
MYEITIENNHNSKETYEAVIYAAKLHSKKACKNTMLMNIGEGSKFILTLNQPVATPIGLIRPVSEGAPAAIAGYLDRPLYYQKVVIETDDEPKAIEWIRTAQKLYTEMKNTFEKTPGKIVVLTYHGGWENEFTAVRRSNLYLPGKTYQTIFEDLKLFYDSDADYKRLDIPWTRTYMLHGLPGTGKTTLVYTLATALEKRLAIFDFTDQDMSDTSLRRALFRLPEDTILVLEDVDSLFKERESDTTGVTFSGLLNALDGVIKNTGLVVFMTTNHISNVDDTALKRRVDYYLKFDVMKPDQIEAMFVKFYPDQDVKPFLDAVSSLTLTPCILQKFFVKRLRSTNVLSDVKELEDMCNHEYKLLVEQNAMYM